ncbi:hypothetical protein PybrP1_010953 [[Pythium] brassicae (nom. inval.)]|nr:hypothetical protein PybrP1_010953 [[Pythium] brassicae (nom. inval.)]
MAPLPAGWLVRVSRSKGKVYYFHTRSQRTQWHQLEAIARVLQTITVQDAAAMAETRVDRFLFQHSTGAGKTMTIAALAHQLLYAVDACGGRFHTVVIMIDRVKLDEQVGGTVETFLRRNGIDEVFRAESIGHLAALMDNSGGSEPKGQVQPPAAQRVIITTTHKMGLLVKDEVLLTRMLHRTSHEAAAAAADDDGGEGGGSAGRREFSRIAIVTDEAHRSHTASTRETIQKVMKAGEGSDNARITFVGFTATPNAEALHLFGTRAAGGALRPFHCYPIARATADGRVKDVLANYKCVRFEVETTIPSDVVEVLRDGHALRDVLDHASDDVAVLKAKAALMMQDFLDTKSASKAAKVGGRRDVLRYYQLVAVFITNRQLKWSMYAAFSGSLALEDGSGSTVTEDTLNGSQLNLATSDIVIVCDKLDTGYNDPRLSCMYIDRYLRSSSQTVQLTSRLNRLHKDKPHVHIMDFSNHAAQIRRSYATFWDETRVPSDAADVDVDAELADVTTGLTILCDFFPALWEAPHRVDARAFARERIVPLERDSFHQVLDALRLCCSGLSRYDLASQLKKAIEGEMRAADSLSSAVDVEEIKRKMSARISSYQKVFSGALHPDSVLRLAADATWDEANASEQLQERGPLEAFEALVRLSECAAADTDTTRVVDVLRATAARVREDAASEEACNPLARQVERFIRRFSRA